jgi:Rieske Fe-S protein
LEKSDGKREEFMKAEDSTQRHILKNDLERPRSIERRSFLGYMIAMIGTSIASVLGITIVRYTIGPALSPSGTSEWTNAGLLEEIPDDKPTKRSLVISQEAGWGRMNTQRLVWIIRKGNDLTVFSAVCPHLGCTINEAANGFICPCHGSAWNALGKKIGGPAPRNLDVLEHRRNGDILEVRYRSFKQGVAGQEVVS